MLRTVDQWRDILLAKSAVQCAERILGDIIAWNPRSDYTRSDDVVQLANAIQAIRELANEATLREKQEVE